MRHPYEKFIRIELFSLGLAVLFGVITLVRGYILLAFVSFYLISLSIAAEAMIAWLTHDKEQAIKLLVRSILIFIIATFLFIKT